MKDQPIAPKIAEKLCVRVRLAALLSNPKPISSHTLKNKRVSTPGDLVTVRQFVKRTCYPSHVRRLLLTGYIQRTSNVGRTRNTWSTPRARSPFLSPRLLGRDALSLGECSGSVE